MSAPLTKFVTYEHEDTGFEVEVMSYEEFIDGGAKRVDESDTYVWQWALDKEQALEQHYFKHDLWRADIAAGISDKGKVY